MYSKKFRRHPARDVLVGQWAFRVKCTSIENSFSSSDDRFTLRLGEFWDGESVPGNRVRKAKIKLQQWVNRQGKVSMMQIADQPAR